MTFGDVYYQDGHRTQFDGGPKASQNCVPTSLADAAAQVSAGGIDRTGSEVRALVHVSEETNPITPGWSLQDADLAARRLGIEFTPAAGPWASVVTLRSQGRGIVLNGDSDVFTEGCSATFDGNHCVYLPPKDDGSGRWRLGDPLCKDWRWEKPAVLARYAAKFAGSGLAIYGYTAIMPPAVPDTGTEEPMGPLMVTSTTPMIVDPIEGRQLLRADATPGPMVSNIGAIASAYQVQYGGGAKARSIAVTSSGVMQLLFVRESDCASIKPVPPAGDVKHAVEVTVDGQSKWKGSV